MTVPALLAEPRTRAKYICAIFLGCACAWTECLQLGNVWRCQLLRIFRCLQKQYAAEAVCSRSSVSVCHAAPQVLAIMHVPIRMHQGSNRDLGQGRRAGPFRQSIGVLTARTGDGACLCFSVDAAHTLACRQSLCCLYVAVPVCRLHPCVGCMCARLRNATAWMLTKKRWALGWVVPVVVHDFAAVRANMVVIMP